MACLVRKVSLTLNHTQLSANAKHGVALMPCDTQHRYERWRLPVAMFQIYVIISLKTLYMKIIRYIQNQCHNVYNKRNKYRMFNVLGIHLVGVKLRELSQATKFSGGCSNLTQSHRHQNKFIVPCCSHTANTLTRTRTRIQSTDRFWAYIDFGSIAYTIFKHSFLRIISLRHYYC